MRKFDRGTNQRKALFKSLANSLILHEKIVTTEPKAKEMRPIVEKLITKAKKGDIHSRRMINASLGNPNAVAKMFDLVGPAFKDRNGGYLRITKLSRRSGDSASMAKVEFVEEVSSAKKVKAVEIKEKETKTQSRKMAKVLAKKAKINGEIKKVRKTAK
jgi:large subunit ribosomal protein L17